MLAIYYREVDLERKNCLEIESKLYRVISNDVANKQILFVPIESTRQPPQQFSHQDLLKKKAESFCYPCSGSGDRDSSLSLGSTRVRNYPTCKYCEGDGRRLLEIEQKY